MSWGSFFITAGLILGAALEQGNWKRGKHPSSRINLKKSYGLKLEKQIA